MTTLLIRGGGEEKSRHEGRREFMREERVREGRREFVRGERGGGCREIEKERETGDCRIAP
jgi:hypothetical protein